MGEKPLLSERLKRRSEREISYNTRVRIMGDIVEICVCDAPVFRQEGYEVNRPRDKLPLSVENSGDDAEKSDKTDYERDIKRSAGRAGKKLREYALCNSLPYFVTFTLDGHKIDRYDPKAITKKLNQWLDNRVRRKGLQYLIVAEWHKDGAVHFHGLINDVLPRSDSGTMIPPGGGKPRKPRSKRQRAEWLEAGGQIVYNLPDWSLGFSTAVEIKGDYNQTVNYVCKYITKQATDPRGMVGGRWYYHSGNLKKPVDLLATWNIAEAASAGGRVWNVPEAGRSFVYLTITREELPKWDNIFIYPNF